MSLEADFQNKIRNIQSKNPKYARNALNEVLQDYILNYVYNSNYNDLIFTGGTCLRKVYGLDRLSEDLDFDYINRFDISGFSSSVAEYFKSTFKIIIEAKISNNLHTIYLKIPIKKYKNILNLNVESDVLFLRCDFSQDTVGEYNVEVNPVNTDRFSFFVTNYDLPTLFTNKIVAFLERTFYKDDVQQVSLKGRDIYDLFWLINLSAKTSFNLKPNQKRLIKLTGEKDINKIKSMIKDKLNKIEPQYVYNDLYALVESEKFLNQFIKNYDLYINEKLNYIL